MATWKKVIVSGSNANLASLQVDNLISGQVVIGGGSGSVLSTTAINGTGNIVATTNATNLTHSGSFSGSFSGNIVTTLANVSKPNFVAYDITTGTFSYTGTGSFTATTASYAVSASVAISSSYAFNATSASYAASASVAISSSYAVNATNAASATLATTASYAFSSSVAVSSSYALNSSTAFNATTSSYAASASVAVSASYALNATTAASANQVANALSFGGGVSASVVSYNGSAAVTTVLNNFQNFTNNTIQKWNGTNFTNSNIVDTGTQVQIGSGASSGVNVAAGGINVTGNSTFNNDLTVTGNLSVAGTASFTNTDNLNIRDKFILINSGSGVLADSGWITQYNAAGSGSAFYLEANSAGTYGRFAVAYDVIGTSTAINVDEFVVTAKVNQSAPGAATPTWGGSSTNGQGNMWLTTTGDIYIWA